MAIRETVTNIHAQEALNARDGKNIDINIIVAMHIYYIIYVYNILYIYVCNCLPDQY